MKLKLFAGRLFLTAIASLAAAGFIHCVINTASAKDYAAEKERELYKNKGVISDVEYDINLKTGKKIKKLINKYNSKGLKIETIEYKPDSQILERRYEYLYDTSSNEISRVEYNIDGIIKSSREFTYDTFGVNLLKEVIFNGKNIAVKLRVYKYDNAGNAIEQYVYGIDDRLESKTTYTYNENHCKTELVIYGKNNIPAVKWIYKYNDKHNLIEAESYDAAGEMTGKWVYSYNEKGLLDKIIGYNSKNAAVTSKKIEYEYRTAAPVTARSIIARKYNTDISKPFIDPEFGDPDAPHIFYFINQVQVSTAEEINKMLDEGKFDINYQGDNGWSALISAASYGNAEGVKALLARGAKTDLKDRRGMTALDYAIKIKNKEIIKILRGNVIK